MSRRTLSAEVAIPPGLCFEFAEGVVGSSARISATGRVSSVVASEDGRVTVGIEIDKTSLDDVRINGRYSLRTWLELRKMKNGVTE